MLKCKCGCCFIWESDLRRHLMTHWKQSKNGDGEWMPSEYHPYLTTRLRANGGFESGGWRYALLDQKVLYRSRVAKPRY